MSFVFDVHEHGLACDAAVPLSRDMRAFMEARLGADFSDVRIHIGAAADALCGALNARAFTMGRDIVFAHGQYAPDTPGGRWLLAHELVHILQQRAAALHAPAAPVAVGNSQDACEIEANRLATEALDGGRRSAVTPDGAGAIRRAITIVEKTAQIEAKYAEKTTKPGITYVRQGDEDKAVLHLTSNAGPIIRGEKIEAASKVSAIRLTGLVLVQADPKDDVDATWRFHFYQLFHHETETWAYAGRTSSDGSKMLNVVGPTFYKGHGKYVPDGYPGSRFPTYIDQWNDVTWNDPLPQWTANVIEDDHPFAKAPQIRANPLTKKDNYLYSIDRKFDVVTALVALNLKTDVTKPLAYITWGATCKAELHWSVDRAGAAKPDPPKMFVADFWVGKMVQGAHPDKTLAALIANPETNPDKMYNDMIRDADYFTRAATTNSANVTISKSWPSAKSGGMPTVPIDHFK